MITHTPNLTFFPSFFLLLPENVLNNYTVELNLNLAVESRHQRLKLLGFLSLISYKAPAPIITSTIFAITHQQKIISIHVFHFT